MKKNNQAEEIESEATRELEEKIKKRERKKKKGMLVSGKSVLKIKELKEKKEKDLSTKDN